METTKRIHVGYVSAGFLMLLISAYLDNVRGPLLPVLSKTLDLPYVKVSGILVIGNLVAIVALFLLPVLLNKLGDLRTTSLLCVLLLFTLVFTHFTVGYGTLVFLGSLIGMGVAMIGTLSNINVMDGTPEGKRHRFLCALHVMYGVGSLLAPVGVAWVLKQNLSWTVSIQILIAPILLLWIVSAFAMRSGKHTVKTTYNLKLSLWQATLLVGFCSYVAGEVIISMWMVAFLVEARGYSVESASPILTVFFLMMAITRLLCFFSLPQKAIRFFCLACLSLSAFSFSYGLTKNVWGFAFAGILGPFFPLFLSSLSNRFPESWRSITIWLIIAVQVTLALSHTLVGAAVDWLGIEKVYRAPLPLFVGAFLTVLLFFRGSESRSPVKE